MANPREYWTCRVLRADGSVTYKCHRVGPVHAEREAAAWNAEDGWSAMVVKESNPFYKAERAAWRKAIVDGGRFFPE